MVLSICRMFFISFILTNHDAYKVWTISRYTHCRMTATVYNEETRQYIALWSYSIYIPCGGKARSSAKSEVRSSNDDSGQVLVECTRYGTVTVTNHSHLLTIYIIIYYATKASNHLTSFSTAGQLITHKLYTQRYTKIIKWSIKSARMTIDAIKSFF